MKDAGDGSEGEGRVLGEGVGREACRGGVKGEGGEGDEGSVTDASPEPPRGRGAAALQQVQQEGGRTACPPAGAAAAPPPAPTAGWPTLSPRRPVPVL